MTKEPTSGWLDEVAEKIDLTGALMSLPHQQMSFGRLLDIKSSLADNYIGLLSAAIAHLEAELTKGDDPLVKLSLEEDLDYFKSILEGMTPLDPLLLKLVMGGEMRAAINALVSEELDALQSRLSRNLDSWLLRHDPDDLRRLWGDLNRRRDDMKAAFLRRYPKATRPETFDDVREEDQSDVAYRVIVQQDASIDLLAIHMGLTGLGGLINSSR